MMLSAKDATISVFSEFSFDTLESSLSRQGAVLTARATGNEEADWKLTIDQEPEADEESRLTGRRVYIDKLEIEEQLCALTNSEDISLSRVATLAGIGESDSWCCISKLETLRRTGRINGKI
jgi:hypothetical protein